MKEENKSLKEDISKICDRNKQMKEAIRDKDSEKQHNDK